MFDVEDLPSPCQIQHPETLVASGVIPIPAGIWAPLPES
jgi:hypothetical protein